MMALVKIIKFISIRSRYANAVKCGTMQQMILFFVLGLYKVVGKFDVAKLLLRLGFMHLSCVETK